MSEEQSNPTPQIPADFSQTIEELVQFRFVRTPNNPDGALEVKLSNKVVTPGGAIKEPSETVIISGDAVPDILSILRMIKQNVRSAIIKQEEAGRQKILKALKEQQENKGEVVGARSTAIADFQVNKGPEDAPAGEPEEETSAEETPTDDSG